MRSSKLLTFVFAFLVSITCFRISWAADRDFIRELAVNIDSPQTFKIVDDLKSHIKKIAVKDQKTAIKLYIDTRQFLEDKMAQVDQQYGEIPDDSFLEEIGNDFGYYSKNREKKEPRLRRTTFLSLIIFSIFPLLGFASSSYFYIDENRRKKDGIRN